MIQQRSPKTIFVRREGLCLAVADVTIVFNDGECGRFGFFGKLGMEVGKWTKLCFQSMDKDKVAATQIEATADALFVPQARALQAAALDTNREKLYLAGAYE